MLAAVADGSLTATIAASYPLADVADAMRELMTGHTSGKIVLVP